MTINASACPLCGQSNRCAMEIEKIEGQKQAACWCTCASFSAELLARVPANSQNKACICADCAKSGALLAAAGGQSPKKTSQTVSS